MATSGAFPSWVKHIRQGDRVQVESLTGISKGIIQTGKVSLISPTLDWIFVDVPAGRYFKRTLVIHPPRMIPEFKILCRGTPLDKLLRMRAANARSVARYKEKQNFGQAPLF